MRIFDALAKEWELDLKAKFGRPYASYPDFIANLGSMAQTVADSMAVSLQNSQDELVKLQRDITVYVEQRPAFTAAWLEAGRARREEMILEGLVRTCDAVPDMEDRRTNCPESSFDFLQRGNGQGFLDLFEAMRDPGSAPRIVPHKAFDAMIGVGNQAKRTSAEKLYGRHMAVTRNFFLAMMVWNTLLTFHGEKEHYRAAKTTSGTQERKAEARLKKFDREIYEETMEDHEGAQWCCRACGLMTDMLPQGKRLQSCAQCKPLGRTVKYCDRACQKADWKKHKKICGKALDAESTLATLVGELELGAPTPPVLRELDESDSEPALNGEADGDEFPLPVAPFVHSRQLKHQIKLLKENPRVDYVVTQSAPKDDYGVMLPHPMGQMMFLVMRRRAMATGDPQAVTMLYTFIAPFALNNGVTLKAVRAQLVAEYGVTEKLLENTPLK